MTGTHPVEREEVMAWLDGELPAVRAADVATHVASCADCGALAADLRDVSDRVAVWRVEPAPPAFLTPGRELRRTPASSSARARFRRNARIEEQRLNELLRTRTGDLKDVLEVEQHIARVRTDLERMESEALATRTRVAQATISLAVNEIYKADLAEPLGAQPLTIQMRNALVGGVRTSTQTGVAIVIGVLRLTPILAPWIAALFVARIVWRRRRVQTR